MSDVEKVRLKNFLETTTTTIACSESLLITWMMRNSFNFWFVLCHTNIKLSIPTYCMPQVFKKVLLSTWPWCQCWPIFACYGFEKCSCNFVSSAHNQFNLPIKVDIEERYNCRAMFSWMIPLVENENVILTGVRCLEILTFKLFLCRSHLAA